MYYTNTFKSMFRRWLILSCNGGGVVRTKVVVYVTLTETRWTALTLDLDRMLAVHWSTRRLLAHHFSPQALACRTCVSLPRVSMFIFDPVHVTTPLTLARL